MKKKQFIALLLAAMMSMSTFSAYAMTDREAVDRATSFGWVEKDYEADKNVTRAEFAEIMVKFSGMEPGTNTVSSYDDISGSDERLAYINTAVERGIMSPYLNNKFDPDGTVTKQQVAKAVLAVLGYSAWAEQSGGYPSGYTKIALGTDMFDGVKGDMTAVMTYSDIVRILANSATIPLCEPAVEKGIVVYKKNDDKTLLSEMYDVTFVKGRIISNGVTSLVDGYVPRGFVLIETKDGGMLRIEDGGVDVSQYIGTNASIYYRNIDGADTLAYIVPDTKTTELTISNDSIDDYSNGVYTYYIDGKRKTAKVSKDADVIYNGKKVNDISVFKDVSYMYYPRSSSDTVMDGTVRLISTTGSSTYDVVFINAMNCYAVDHYSESNDSIYLRDNKPALDVEDDDKFDIYDIDGNPVELKSLTKWDIIEEYKSADGSYSRYVVVRNSIQGTVDSIRTSTGDHGTIVIDGVEYPYDDDGKISIGTTGVFLLSSTGRVVMMTDEVAHAANFGYIVKAYGEPYEDIFHVKMLTMDGEIVEYESASKVKYDGDSISAQTIKDWANEDMLNRQLVAYELSDGKIKTIDTAKANSKTTPSDLRLIYSNTQGSSATDDEKNTGLIYKKNLSCFGGKIIVNADTKMIVVPDKLSSFDNYMIKNLSGLRNDGNYKNLSAYTLGTDSQKAMVIVQEIEGGIDVDFADDSNIAVVESITSGINPVGEESQCMTVYVNGTLQDVYGEDYLTLGKYENGNFYPLSVGDIVRYNVDANGIVSGWKQTSNGWVSGLDPVYVQSYDRFEIPDTFERNIYGGDRRFACRVYDRVDDFIGVAVKSPLDKVKSENGDVVYFSATNTNVYIYDQKRKTVEKGTVDDLETYKAVGADCSTVYVSAFKGELKDVVIFK